MAKSIKLYIKKKKKKKKKKDKTMWARNYLKFKLGICFFFV